MREAALLQSFPSLFEFEGSLDSVFKQIGEAVPPRFSAAIAASILVDLATKYLGSERDVSAFASSAPMATGTHH